MSLLRSLSDRLRALFRKEQVSQELDEELNGFLEMAAEEKMKLGMGRKDALRAVRLEQGTLEVTKEVVRSASWESFVETCWQDLRFGARLVVADENSYPTLRVVLPGHPDSDKTIEVIFPEHVTVRHVGDTEGKHLFLFQPGQHGDRPAWRQVGRSLQYEKDFAGGLHMLATAMLEDDGVRFSYEFVNRSQLVYEMIYAPTDPRLTSMFHDVRLERTYVHHEDGFDLLASETPSRLTIPLDQWLPARYLASYTWPIPAKKVEKRDNDGITYYNKSRAVDEPLIATVSSDGKWVVASFTRTTGNVWSNPELTCQHVDPQIPLAVGASAAMETKLLVFQGSLHDVLKKVDSQRQSLR